MPDVNVDRVRELTGHVRDATRQLRDMRTMSVAAFTSDRRAVNSAKYLLIVACEAALDICNHLVARRGGRTPADYGDCMTILGELGAIDAELTRRLVRMARFRNLLVHVYGKVDDAEVFRVITGDLEDFDRYLVAVGRYIGATLE